MFEKRVLRRIFRSKKDEVTGYSAMKNCIICTVQKAL
jgi:hypothetical protein